MTLDDQTLRSVLDYAPETGRFHWRVSRGTRKAGDVAGTVGAEGYIYLKVYGRSYRAHRLAWLYVFGEWPRDEIDHINGDRSDNRLSNLRDVPHGVNTQNQRSARGCYTRGGRFFAHIRLGKTLHHIGTFDTEEAARAAYVARKRELHDGCTL